MGKPKLLGNPKFCFYRRIVCAFSYVLVVGTLKCILRAAGLADASRGAVPHIAAPNLFHHTPFNAIHKLHIRHIRLFSYKTIANREHLSLPCRDAQRIFCEHLLRRVVAATVCQRLYQAHMLFAIGPLLVIQPFAQQFFECPCRKYHVHEKHNIQRFFQSGLHSLGNGLGQQIRY